MAPRLAARFEVYYTPKGGSWLHQLELDFSALARQSLQRRMPTQAHRTSQVPTWSRQRQAQRVTIRWQFTVADARQTRNSQYGKVNKANKKDYKTASTQYLIPLD
jgi:hypothetical protein